MFTGLVEGTGVIKAVKRIHEDVELQIEPLFIMTDINIGDSISVDGVCLTITGINEGVFSVDVSGETLSRSTISRIRPGDEVNLERALRLSDRLGGHLVSGHVDGTGKIIEKVRDQRSWRLKIGIDSRLAKYTIEKGSIAVDGISLTINCCQDTFFEVNIIPQTARETRLLKKKAGDLVNIETDLIGKYVEKMFRKNGASQDESGLSGINREMLKKYGFGD